jgi:ADP-ribose pyrophosphatase YjhB (NUDIX family)
VVEVVVGCGCVIAEDGRYLLVREAKPAARGRFALPAGKLEPDETLQEAAIRECLEETGLEVRLERLLGLYHCPRTSEGFAVVNVVFAARATGGEARTSADHPELRWCSRADVAELSVAGLLRGRHVERAIDAHAAGVHLPLDLVELVEASPVP